MGTSTLSWRRRDLKSSNAVLFEARHIAFIMDGNRRFARGEGLKVTEGHLKGVDTAKNVANWCYDLGVRELSLYAFSIENFKRPKEEVDYLMKLLEEKIYFSY